MIAADGAPDAPRLRGDGMDGGEGRIGSGGRYTLYGGLGSPYSMKMRAILRYRRLPHDWVQLGTPGAPDVLSQVAVPVIPVLRFPDGRHANDSTPLLLELERRHPGERSIVPADAAHAFLASLLEDMADEWGTKAMFLYRWLRERDQAQMSEWLAFDRLAGHGRAAIIEHAARFRDRQVGRMAIVGCTPANAPLVEASADRVMALLDAHVTEERYLFGTRPSLADFGWLGQLSQLAVDPTPAEHMRARFPSVLRWLMQLDDASGVEGDWRDPGAALPAAVTGLLAIAAEVYLPYLEANAAAIAAGAGTLRLHAWGMDYEQGVVKYQVRCLQALRAGYAGLGAPARARVDATLPAAARASLGR
jgi:glutathione S-transferase